MNFTDCSLNRRSKWLCFIFFASSFFGCASIGTNPSRSPQSLMNKNKADRDRVKFVMRAHNLTAAEMFSSPLRREDSEMFLESFKSYRPLLISIQNGKESAYIGAKVKSRGRGRFNSCYFTPLTVKLPKSSHPEFIDSNGFKLVLPCQPYNPHLPGVASIVEFERHLKGLDLQDSKEVDVEYFLYYLWERMADPFSFRTRRGLLAYHTEDSTGSSVTWNLNALLLEDKKDLEARTSLSYAEDSLSSYLKEGYEIDKKLEFFNFVFNYIVGNDDEGNNQRFLADSKQKTLIPIAWDLDANRIFLFTMGRQFSPEDLENLSSFRERWSTYSESERNKLTSWYLEIKEKLGIRDNKNIIDQIIRTEAERLKSDASKQKGKDPFSSFFSGDIHKDLIPEWIANNEYPAINTFFEQAFSELDAIFLSGN